jgi:DNA-binding transcriptional LysR family regulator
VRLNLRQIEVFRAIMLTGSISGAAKLLHVSQPAVSRLISYAEQRLGIALFERIKGRLYPTPEAQRLFVEVNAVYQSVQRVNEVAEDLIENRMGHLRIACSPNLGQSLLPRAIARFYDHYPDVRIILHTMIPSVLMQAVLTQQVELGIAFLQDTHPNVEILPLYENRMVAAVAASHPFARRKSLAVRDLADTPLIGYGSDIPLGQLVRRLFSDEGLVPQVKIEVQQAHVACALVQAGTGIALIDELTVAGPVWPQIVVKPIVPTIAAPVSIMHPVHAPLSRLAHAFIETLKSLPANA